MFNFEEIVRKIVYTKRKLPTGLLFPSWVHRNREWGPQRRFLGVGLLVRL